MISLNVLYESYWITKPFTTFRAGIDCHLLHPSSVATLLMDFFYVVYKSGDGGKLSTTLRTLLQLPVSTPTAAALPRSILCYLPLLAKFATQFCHTRFS